MKTKSQYPILQKNKSRVPNTKSEFPGSFDEPPAAPDEGAAGFSRNDMFRWVSSLLLLFWVFLQITRNAFSITDLAPEDDSLFESIFLCFHIAHHKRLATSLRRHPGSKGKGAF